jgi:hypothetical protein
MADAQPDELTAARLLEHLDGPVTDGRRRDILDAFAGSLNPLFAYLVEAGGCSEDGERAFALLHLASRSISDLVAAAHLATHAYLQQAYTSMRPVHENTDLMELIAQEPSEAHRWINSETPWVDFRPKLVRDRIGAPEEDVALYSHLCEMGSHPRFAGTHAAGAMKVNVDDPADRRAVLRMGSFFEWHPATVSIWTLLFQMVVRLGFKLRHLSGVTPGASWTRWLEIYRASVEEANRGCDLVRQELVAMGHSEGTEFLEGAFDGLLDRLKSGGDLAKDAELADHGATAHEVRPTS